MWGYFFITVPPACLCARCSVHELGTVSTARGWTWLTEGCRGSIVPDHRVRTFPMIFDSLALALAYLDRHMYTRYIFPIKAGAKFPPLLKDNLDGNCSNDIKQIIAWAKKFPGCNWGVAARKSGIMPIDVDTNKAKGKVGDETYADLDLIFGWPETETTTSPSGGKHHIYEGWADDDHPAHIMALGENGIGKDIDVPNYVLIPGCTLADGTSYVGNEP